MYEVKFNKEPNIKKDIETNIKTRKKLIFKNFLLQIAIMFVGTSIGGVIASIIMTKPLSFMIIVSNSLFLSGCYLITSVLYTVVDMIVNYCSKTKANHDLEDVVITLAENNINTNVNRLTNSIVLENSTKRTKETVNDGVKLSEEKELNETYYWFLDNNSNICGLLEQNNNHTINNDTESDTKFYLLEDEDISSLNPPLSIRVTKKLVRKREDIDKKC